MLHMQFSNERQKKGSDGHEASAKKTYSCLDPVFIRQSNHSVKPFFVASCHLYPPQLWRRCSTCERNYTEHFLLNEVVYNV